jgi:hypothetical protein
VASAGLHTGSGGFRAIIAACPEDTRARLIRLADWADYLEREGLADLLTFHGKAVTSLRPRVAGDKACLVSIACDTRSAYVQFWRSVFERCAPESIPLVEAELRASLRQGTSAHESPEPLIDTLTQAYREAARRKDRRTSLDGKTT